MARILWLLPLLVVLLAAACGSSEPAGQADAPGADNEPSATAPADPTPAEPAATPAEHADAAAASPSPPPDASDADTVEQRPKVYFISTDW